MMVTCGSCGISTDDSTGRCQLCDNPLNNSQPQQVSAAPVAPPALQISSNQISSATLDSSYFAPINPVTDEIDRDSMFELPVNLTKATVGRTDISIGNIPTISVEKRWPKEWISVRKGNGVNDLFSRKTGTFRRDPISGKLFFQVDARCGVVVLIAAPNSDDFQPFLKGDEKLISSGTKLAFGQGGDVLKTIVL